MALKASTRGSKRTIRGDKKAGCSHFYPTISLNNWWLIQARDDVGGKTLAVAGVYSKRRRPRRVFSSAPIAKRFDVFNLETADGVYVILQGFINKNKTIENGFSPEVFKYFLFGFPGNWEQCAEKFLETVSGSFSEEHGLPTPSGIAGINSSIPTSVSGSLNSCIPNSKGPINFSDDDLPNHAAEGEIDRANSGSNDMQSMGRPKNLGGNQKRPVSRCLMNRKVTKSAPPSQSFESLSGASGATTQSGGKVSISEECPRYSSGRIFRNLSRNIRSERKEKQMVGSELNSKRNTVASVPAVSKTSSVILSSNIRSKRKEKQTVGSGLNSKRNTVDSVSAVSKTMRISLSSNKRSKGKEKQMVGRGLNSKRNKLDSFPAVSKTSSISSQNDNGKTGGGCMSHPSDPELPEPADLKVAKKLDFGCLEDDSQLSCNIKGRQNSGNITAQVGEGKRDANNESTPRKGTKTKTTFHTEETPTLEVNKKVSIASPESLNLKRSRRGRLLLPAMEFWRNQLAIYDMDGTITGIQEELPVATPSRGSRSGSQGSKRRR